MTSITEFINTNSKHDLTEDEAEDVYEIIQGDDIYTHLLPILKRVGFGHDIDPRGKRKLLRQLRGFYTDKW